MKLLYVRHGKTEGNLAGNYIGRTESPLTDEGRLQAVQAGKGIVEAGEVVDVIYSGSLGRQEETAEIIAKQIGYPVDSIAINDLLLERAGGSFEGRPQKEFFAASEDEQVAAGAESFKGLADRAMAMVELARSHHQGQTVLFVGSAAIGEMMRAMIKYGDHTKMFDDGPIPNAEVIRFI